MTRDGVRRLVCISALGVGDSRGHGGFVFETLSPFPSEPEHTRLTSSLSGTAPGH